MQNRMLSEYRLFAGLSEEECQAVLGCVGGWESPAQKGELLAHAGEEHAAMGLVLIAVYSIAKGVIKDWFSGISSLAGILLIEFTNMSVVLIVLLFLVTGILRALWNTRREGGLK